MEGGEDSPPWLLVVFGAVRIESEICPRLTGESDDGPQLWEMEAPSLPQQEGELSFIVVTTSAVTAEKKVASNLSVFLQRNTTKVRRN